MSNGELKQYLAEKYNGDIIVSSIDTSVSIGGLRNPRFRKVILNIPPVKMSKVDKVLLDVSISTTFNPLNIKWKLLFDEFTLTREFKPQILVEDNGFYYSKLIFDLTPVYKYSTKHTLGVQFEGAEPITVEHVNLVIFYPVEGASSSITYLSGALLLKPGEETALNVSIEPIEGEGFVKIVGVVPSRQAKVKVFFNDKLIHTIEGVLGVEEITASPIDVNDENIIKIQHLPSTTRYYPSSFRLSTIIVGKNKIPLPRITISETKVEDNKLIIKITNQGMVEPDRLILLVTHLGSIIYRGKLKPLKPGETELIEVPLKGIRGCNNITIRAIWGKLSKTEFVEAKVKVSES